MACLLEALYTKSISQYFVLRNPTFMSINSAKLWCYYLLVYMPMSYLYGKRFVGPITPLVLELREELILQPYNEINWKEAQHLCAKVGFRKPLLFPGTYHNCLAIRKAVEFLLNSQSDDSGWGESYISCPAKVSFTCHLP